MAGGILGGVTNTLGNTTKGVTDTIGNTVGSVGKGKLQHDISPCQTHNFTTCKQSISLIYSPCVGEGVGNLGQGVGNTLGGVTEGVSDTTKGVGDTVKGGTDSIGGKKQDAQNPLGL
jgi:hypothetical protein